MLRPPTRNEIFLLLQGPVAQCWRDVIVAFQGQVGSAQALDQYFFLFPKGSDAISKALVVATFRTALDNNDEIFPVVYGTERVVHWTRGPAPDKCVAATKFPDEVQDALTSDGLDLAHLPVDLMTVSYQ